MAPRSFLSYMMDLAQAGRDVEQFMQNLDKATFAQDSKTQSSVERKFEVMGEALSQARRHHPRELEQLGEVQTVIDFRNFIAHQYHEIESEVMWRVVKNDLPEFMGRVHRLLEQVRLSG